METKVRIRKNRGPGIVAVGIATLDIINTVDDYPAEDSEVRARAQRICRGGNATNTLTVLSRLGHPCTWAGVWVDEPNGRRIRAELDAAGIDSRFCRVENQGSMPVSYITLNRRNGSRTIVHYRDLPEFGFADFQRIDLSGQAWLHFEGRNVPETLRMLQSARGLPPRLSVEVEKTRDGIETLFPHADLLLFGKHFVRHAGHTPESFLPALARQFPATDLVCAWGEHGAYAIAAGNPALLYSPAFPPATVIDTIGAGDTFNAGIIHGLSAGMTLARALAFACRLAGEKCGRTGL